jgi:acetyltransferase
MVDVSWGDLIYYLGDDPRTKSILLYMESVGDARGFLSAAREVALAKPVIVIKAGRTAQGGKAAASHPGARTGSDEVLDAAFRRSGVLRVSRISELFYMAEVLAKQPPPKGPKLTIVTNAGGPAVLATDALIASGAELTELSPETFEEFNSFLPSTWSRNNPVDIIGDATPERYAKALATAARDKNSDGMLVILTPQDMTIPRRSPSNSSPTPTLAISPCSPVGWRTRGGGRRTDPEPGRHSHLLLSRYGRPHVHLRWQYGENLRGLYETPVFAGEADVDRAAVERIVEHARGSGGRC